MKAADVPWYRYTRTLAGVPMPLVVVRLETDGARVEAVALIDSGADSSVFNVAIARRLGLRPGDAVPVPMTVADGSTTSAAEWPSAEVSIAFGPTGRSSAGTSSTRDEGRASSTCSAARTS